MKKHRIDNLSPYWISLMLPLLAACTLNELAGGSGSTTTNGTVVGKVVTANGDPLSKTQVQMLPASYNPVVGGYELPTDTTDEDGEYAFNRVTPGSYNIQSVSYYGTRTLHRGIFSAHDTIVVAPDTLRQPGSLKCLFPGLTLNSRCYIYLPGTSFFALVQNGFALIDSVPAGMVPEVRYVDPADSTHNHAIDTNVTIASNHTTMVFDVAQWKYSKALLLNTTPSGADVAGNVTNFPVLIRLSSGNFAFNQAKRDGADIGFTKSDGSPLPFEIEHWDAGAQTAEIWVKIDTVYGNDSSRYFMMYWGNPNATALSSAESVFDTAGGFLGVWHLAGAGNAEARDATPHHYDGTPTDTAPRTIPGVIGSALQFDGKANGLVMKNTANSPLNFPRPGTYTFSAWVSVDTVFDNDDEFIAGKGHDQYALRVKGGQSIPANMFALHEYIDAPVYGTEMRYAPVVTRQWKYMVGIRDTARSYLYIDGTCVDSAGMVVSGWKSVQDSTSFSIGRCGAPFNVNNYLPFKGNIDEVRIARVACSADWVKLCYMNQKPGDVLIKFPK